MTRPAAPIASTVGWGLYCASSWTWCIGMYLPVILIRHFGWPGFLVFAVPNVLGCAGFGYACSRDDSEGLCRDHAGAMVAFSAVTIAYQVFFLAWLATSVAASSAEAGNPFPAGWAAAGAAIFVGVLLSLGRGAFWPALGSAAAVASLALWAVVTPERLGRVPGSGDATFAQLAWAAPIVAFGFLLCPWLDRTFHRARQSAASVHAFGVFGVAFACIILLTAAYTEDGEAMLLPAVVAHMAVQATFTIAAHLRELRVAPCPSGQRRRQLAIVVPVVAGAIAADLPIGFETTYLLFLGCYGLVFPAYVALFIRRSAAPPQEPSPGLAPAWPLTRGRLLAAAAIVAALAPFAAIGFLSLRTWLLPVPVVILVVAALLAPRANRAISRRS
ncbi:MAG: hypothetical protein U0572_12355 [Phycisphaerales bacterium]